MRRIRAVLNRRQPDLTVLMDNVHKPHNLSAITRTCDAVGISEVHGVSSSESFALWHRGASGSERWVERLAHPCVEVALATLRARGMTLAAADVGAQGVDYREVDYTGPFALVVGAELDGLSAAARAAVDLRLSIPMVGMVESLNVSVAVALVLFEAKRQRESQGMYDEPRLDPRDYQRLLFEWAHPKIAAHCQRFGLRYPALDEAGEVSEPFQRGSKKPPAPRSVP